MSQLKFDVAELLVNNQNELFETLEPELKSVLATKNWFDYNGLLLSFEDAFADFIEYKIRWFTVDQTGKSFEEIASVVDKPFLVDLFGESVLNSEGYEK